MIILRNIFLVSLLAAGGWTSATLPRGESTVADETTVSGVAAHELGQSYIFLRVFDDSLVVRLEITGADLERALSFGWDPEVRLELDQVESRLDSIRTYVEARFSLSTDDGPLPIRFRGFDFRFVDFADYVLLDYVIDGPTRIPDEIDILFSLMFDVDTEHLNMLVIEHNWKTGTFNNEAVISLIFSPRNASQTLDLTSSSLWGGFVAFIWQGIWHILIGLDHILFLVALVLPAVLMRENGTWQPVPNFNGALLNIVKIVTFFTIAHSVTLALAALDLIRLPPRPVESMIAASILIAASANLFPTLSIKEWTIAFVFGLFHGFGFANVLGGIGMGGEHLVLTLLGFNIGVELGQIAIICTIFPMLFLLRNRSVYKWILCGGSLMLMAIALYWVIERVFDVDLMIVDALMFLPRLLMGNL